jgi:hypothetical protein
MAASDPGRTGPHVPEVEVDPDDDVEEVELTEDEAREVTSEPVELEGGTTRIAQQNVGSQRVIGSGEYPDPESRPVEPAPGAD